MKIRPLKEIYTRYGYSYHHEFSTKNGYHCYRVMDGDRVAFYELFRHKVKPISDFVKVENRADVPMETHYIAYPSSEEFGRWAWCVKSKERAMEKIVEDLEYQAALR